MGTFKTGNDGKKWSNKKIAVVGGIGVSVLILIIVVLSSGGKSSDDNMPDPKPIRPNPHGYDESILDTQDIFNVEPECKKLDGVYKKVK